MAENLGSRLRVIHLFDAYGALLTSRQQRLVRFYYHDDLSLGEIAARLRISRQAVYDGLRRGIGELTRLERHLGIIRRRRSGESA